MGTTPEGKLNSLVDLAAYLSTPENPVKSGEFKEFWISLTEEEREEFRRTELK